MGEDLKIGCAQPTGGPVEETPEIQKTENDNKIKIKEKTMIKVGGKAPDFTAPAYHKGKFVSIKLSEFSGKWVLLCFYPGDFTFV